MDGHNKATCPLGRYNDEIAALKAQLSRGGGGGQSPFLGQGGQLAVPDAVQDQLKAELAKAKGDLIAGGLEYQRQWEQSVERIRAEERHRVE